MNKIGLVAKAAGLTAVIGTLGLGCGGDQFTPAETDTLETMTVPANPPTSPTNRVADNAAAAKLGQKFYFDTNFSGPLGVASDLGAVGATGKVGCITCHDPANGGTDHRSGGNTSLAAGFTGRNAPTVFNVAFNQGWLLV